MVKDTDILFVTPIMLRGDALSDDELSNFAPQHKPKDIDPEADEQYGRDSSSATENKRELHGREHYEAVGEGRLRRKDSVALGRQYSGTKVTRRGIHQADEGHDPFEGYGSEEESDDDQHMASAPSEEPNENDSLSDGSMEDMSSASEEDEGSRTGDDSDEEDAQPTRQNYPPSTNRTELKRILASQQQNVTSTLAESQRADAAKGSAVRAQRKTFDALLTSRIRLQQGLVALNTLPTISLHTQDSPPDAIASAAQNAETAARKLWATLDGLRCTLADTRTGQKRKRGDRSASMSDMWAHMHSLDATFSEPRRSVLAKWSAKTQPALAVAAKTATNRLNLNGTSGRESSLLDVLDVQLADKEKLVKRMRVAKSAAPVQAKMAGRQRRRIEHDGVADERNGDGGEAEVVFDDADFYSSLLKALLEQRQHASSSATSIDGLRGGVAELDLDSEYRKASTKTRRNDVDTKASKGRKMRFTVHEKLQNFMAPENRGTWTDRQADDLFSSLFGAQRSQRKGEVVEKVFHDGYAGEEEALKLFRN